MCFAVVCGKVGMTYAAGGLGGLCVVGGGGGGFGSRVFVSGEEGVPEGCVLGDEGESSLIPTSETWDWS